MKFRFESNQSFQVQAIEAVTDLFKGQACMQAAMHFTLGSAGLAAVANRLDLDPGAILANLQAVQKAQRIRPDNALQEIAAEIETVEGKKSARFPNFSVEMETGTGKTYVYLRTALELFKRYGMRKFIVVVPSVAIREGVLKTLRITADHFATLYTNPVYRFYEYDSANLTQVRQFAISDAVEVMVMTIASFNKAANVIRQSTDRLQGETPVHLVQAARPILILDEPQNMESEKSIAALSLLDPLFALRYSATHRNPYNVVYRLTPADAYRQGLVKKIEVDSVIQEHDANRPYVRVVEVMARKRVVAAKLAIHKLMADGTVKEKTINVRFDANLAELSGRSEYAGWQVQEIDFFQKRVRFTNNVLLAEGEEQGADKQAIFESQVRHTIERHFERQAALRARGVKVLSLFFIDRVANYVGDGQNPGVLRQMFDRAFDDLKLSRPDWQALAPGDVQAAYFAQKKRKGGAVETLDSVSGETKEDEAAYDLIMRDKELLLAFPDPNDDPATRRKKQVCFIFSHSALREGWDNPNVFQICTLNQTASLTKKRQEVGRGVRLAVDQSGDRVHDASVNVLVVVANESYKQYVETLQDEIAFEYRAEIEARYGKPIAELSAAERRKVEREYGEGILPPPPRKTGERRARLRKARALSEEFKALWERIKHRTRYAVQIDTAKLMADLVPAIEAADVPPPRVTITCAQVSVTDSGVFEAMQLSGVKTAVDMAGRYPLPNLVDVMMNLMENTTPPVKVSRHTLMQLLARVDTTHATANPHEWATAATHILKEKLADLLVHGIQYERIGEWFRMEQILDERTVELFSKFVEAPDETKDKTIYDLIPCDSDIEVQFVKQLEARTDVRLYLKLPYWFTVPTPVGEYRPDWAVVMDGPEADGKPVLYFVSETKSTKNLDELRPEEKRKILCGAAHFGSKQYRKKGALEGVDYRLVTTADELP
jgi:type III restriction enzyme